MPGKNYGTLASYKPRFSRYRYNRASLANPLRTARNQALFRRLASKRAFSTMARRVSAVKSLMPRRRVATDPVLTGPGSLSKMFYNHPPSGRFKRVIDLVKRLPHQQYLVNGVSKITVPLGQQALYNQSIGGQGDLNTLMALRTATPVTTSHICLCAATMDMQFANGTNASLWADVYDITLKSNIGDGTFEATNTVSPSAAFVQGLVAMSAGFGGGGGATGSNINTTPFQSDYFTTTYNVKRVSRHFLEAGAVHRHRVTAKLNYYIDQMEVSANSGIKDVTHWVLVIFYGTPVADSTTDTLISTANGVVNCVTSINYTFAIIDDGAPAAKYSSGLSNVATGEMLPAATALVTSIATT